MILPNLFSKKTPGLFGGLVKTGTRIKHIFSHRVLQIQAYEMTLNAKVKKELDGSIQLGQTPYIWAELGRLEQYGLPQPIRLLLEGWNQAHDGAELDRCANAVPIV